MYPDPNFTLDLSWLVELDVWSWWTLAAVLIILELISPGVFLLWIGIAACLVGMLLLILPDLAWEGQIVAFSVFSAIIIWLQQLWFKRYPIQTENPNLNRRGHQYIGRVFTLETPIVDRIGKITVDDSTWKVCGCDCEAGTKIVITGVDGTILMVDRRPESDDEDLSLTNISPKQAETCIQHKL